MKQPKTDIQRAGHLRDFGGGLSGELTLRREKAELCGYFGDLCEQLEKAGINNEDFLDGIYDYLDESNLGMDLSDLLR